MRLSLAAFLGIVGLSALTSVAQGEELLTSLIVQSRNMPEACEFVYEMESDILITYRNPTLGGTARVELVYGFEDSYQTNSRWLMESAVPMILQGDGTWSVTLTHQTMSTSLHFLYRTMDFYLRVARAGEPTLTVPENASTTRFFRVEFGRQFGEVCHPGGREDTPFRERVIRPPPTHKSLFPLNMT